MVTINQKSSHRGEVRQLALCHEAGLDHKLLLEAAHLAHLAGASPVSPV